MQQKRGPFAFHSGRRTRRAWQAGILRKVGLLLKRSQEIILSLKITKRIKNNE